MSLASWGFLRRFDGAWGKLEDVMNLLSGIVVFALMLFVLGEVLTRLIIHGSIRGFIDITEQAMALFAFLGAAYCQRQGGHIRMEIGVEQLRGRTLWTAEAASTLVAMIIIALLIRGSFSHFWRAFDIGDTTIDAQLVTWPSKLMAPLGLSVLWLRLLLQLLGYIRLALHPDAEPVAVPPIAGRHQAPADE